MAGAIFCSECGVQLIFSYEDAAVATAIHPASDLLEGIQKLASSPSNLSTPSQGRVFLKVIDSGEILPLVRKAETTLGRISEGQSVIPDIDLTPFQGYEAGVSRLHVSIRIEDQGICLVDLGSANGTRVNGKKIPPQSAYLLNHGDVLTLGKLKIQVLVQG
jgi:hypothetical protein